MSSIAGMTQQVFTSTPLPHVDENSKVWDIEEFDIIEYPENNTSLDSFEEKPIKDYLLEKELQKLLEL